MTINKRLAFKPLLLGILIGCLLGLGISAIGFKFYSLVLFERFENYWTPQLESQRFKLTETSASFFLNPDFKDGENCSKNTNPDQTLKSIGVFVENPFNITCQEFVLLKGKVYLIENSPEKYLIFQPNNEQPERLMYVSHKYPTNNMIVKTSDRDEIVVFQEGYNNPAKTLYIQFK
ncbi:hypothetical protein A2Z00_03010 [Candidatus Gottesmanbacteria bacterium RBG_13_45_10]|uniref:Uncharacterized protein n=1 Tax=Candidatus Gottesmanbacteria bacterium RBG_13_45_10 TaxID=1798370 RepID=A0A1F5ZJ37_9BACT|nr:MAG: hypothetical protein A2Z00_03010 [Candidatus Gottesmanbacteria bacterium RBG_13_45_10]